MQHFQQVKGVSQQEDNVYNNPISSMIQFNNNIEKAETLIEKCLKSVIKQKLSGCLINSQRKNRSQQSKLHQSLNKNITEIENYVNQTMKKNRVHLNPQFKHNYRYDLSSKSGNSVVKSSRRNNSTTFTANDNGIQKFTKIQLTERVLTKKQDNRERKKSIEYPKGEQMSFISAINHIEEERTPTRLKLNHNNSIEYKQVQLRLPKLNGIYKSKLLSPPSITKSIGKKDELINYALWKYLTNPKIKKSPRRKTSTSVNEINSLYSSIAQKQQKQQQAKLLNITKQKLLHYIISLPPCLKRLFETVIFFLDIKMPAQLSYQSYTIIAQQAVNINPRAWSVIAFLFWDFNRDGVITTRDIFNIFKEHNNFDNEQKKQNANQVRFRKQSQDSSKKTQIVDAFVRLQNVEKALNLFDRQMKRINELLASQTQILPQQFPYQDSSTINYLEESIITQPNLKYKQISILLGMSPTHKKKGKREMQRKNDVLNKQLGAKCISSYQQCFIATEHNEQTRMAKQKLQKLKSDLFDKRKAKHNEMEMKVKHNLKISKQISYVQAVESQMGQRIKQIMQNLFGFQI